MNRFKIAQYIALGATVLSVTGFAIGGLSGSDIGVYMIAAGVLAAIVSYVFGGLWTAIKMAGKIASWGFKALHFPFCLVSAILSFIFALYAFLFLPIIPVRKAYKESEQEN